MLKSDYIPVKSIVGRFVSGVLVSGKYAVIWEYEKEPFRSPIMTRHMLGAILLMLDYRFSKLPNTPKLLSLFQSPNM